MGDYVHFNRHSGQGSKPKVVSLSRASGFHSPISIINGFVSSILYMFLDLGSLSLSANGYRSSSRVLRSEVQTDFVRNVTMVNQSAFPRAISERRMDRKRRWHVEVRLWNNSAFRVLCIKDMMHPPAAFVFRRRRTAMRNGQRPRISLHRMS